jgi:release factor glutamine methyltransferase
MAWQGIRLQLDPAVYTPSDDTWLLARHAALGPGRRVVELGCGTGLVSIAAAQSGSRVVAVDRNSAAAALASRNAKANGSAVSVVVGHLLSGIDLAGVDAVLCNPPYLPTMDEEHVPGDLDRAFDAGADGLAFVEAFLEDLARQPGPLDRLRIRWVASTLQDVDRVRAMFFARGWASKELDTVRMPHERLVLLEFSRRS